ncbi:unnamed protein product [Dovyalis caffra]|uniref:Uncharacterized protein n=1 Tax=Dovyalis caffra TaxID=77055 RepID=A0AAV1SLG9_9ROSI|nr:unnamed protein product [Dovyalis caffra]
MRDQTKEVDKNMKWEIKKAGYKWGSREAMPSVVLFIIIQHQASGKDREAQSAGPMPNSGLSSRFVHQNEVVIAPNQTLQTV